MSGYKYPWMALQEKRKAQKKEVKVRPMRTTIAKKSSKLKTEAAIYKLLAKDFLKDNPVCQCGRPGCSKKSTEVHHKKGRGTWLNVVEFFLAVCRSCHRWIEEHPIQAKAAGYSLNRLD